MTNYLQEIEAAAARFTADVAKIVRKASKGARHEAHPAEPEGASLVKVYFDGDRDGNTFAVCVPTTETLRVKRSDGSRERAAMWKYTYEDATGTAPGKRSWIGMLKTLDGHGRTVSRVEVYRPSGTEVFDLA